MTYILDTLFLKKHARQPKQRGSRLIKKRWHRASENATLVMCQGQFKLLTHLVPQQKGSRYMKNGGIEPVCSNCKFHIRYEPRPVQVIYSIFFNRSMGQLFIQTVILFQSHNQSETLAKLDLFRGSWSPLCSSLRPPCACCRLLPPAHGARIQS